MDNLILTPNIARELLNNYQQFTRFNKEEVEGFTLANYQKLLTAYGQLYFNTNEIGVVLDRLESLASLNEQALPTAAVPNADQLKILIESHEKFLREKALHDTSWREHQALQIKENLARLKTEAVVYQRESPSLIPIRPDLPEEALGDRIADFAEQDSLKNIEAIIREAGVEENIAKQTAEQINQYVKLTTGEGLVLSPQALQERVETFLSRRGAIVTRAQVEQITERLQTAPSSTPSPYVKTPRPIRAQTREEDQQPEKQEERQASRQQEHLYLIYRGQPYWRTFAGQLSPFSWFGKQKDPTQDSLQLIRSELARIKTDEPQNYRKYSTIFQAIENRVEQLIETGIALESVDFVTPENLEQALQNLDEVADQVQRLEFNETTQSLEKRRETKESLISSLPGHLRQTLEEKGFAAEQATRFAGQEAKRIRQNLLSSLSIKLRQLFTNPNIGWLRWSMSGALAASIPFLPTPMAIAAGGASASLALAQLKHAGGVLKNVGLLVAKVAGVTLGPVGTAIAAAISFAEPILKAVKWIFIGFFAILAFLVFFAITLFHGIFLKENTSLGMVPESKYIAVTKTAEPVSLPNSALPAEVKYTITVTAKEKNLKNIRLAEKFSVYGKNNPPEPSTGNHTLPQTLSVDGPPGTFNFTVRLAPEYADSVVANTVTVTADVEDGPSGESTSKTATVIIGNPPIGCFTFAEGGKGWTPEDKAEVAAAAARIAQYKTYTATLCNQGAIRVFRGTVAKEGESGHVIGKDIYLFDKAFAGIHQLSYTLSHESAHVYAKVDGAVAFSGFANSGATIKEGILPTYPSKYLNNINIIDEDFAETIGLYIIRREFKFLGATNIFEMPNKWPLHYQFARNNIFGQQD